MSTFGDTYVRVRNEVEAEAETIWASIEPQVLSGLATAVKAGVAAALAKGGDFGTMFVAARDATLSILKAMGMSVGQAAIEAAVSHEMAAQTASTTVAA